MLRKILQSSLVILAAAWALAAQAQTTYIHTNPQGSVIAKSDAGGNITARYHYQPFGKRLESSDFSGTGFTGHQRDNDLGLTYMQARYYDETLGRFYSNDPIGFRDVHSFNRYAYGNNNPYRFNDPTGGMSNDFLDAQNQLRQQGFSENDVQQFNQSFNDGMQKAVEVASVAIPVGGEAIAGIKAIRELGSLAATARNGAESAVNAVKLEKQLASESQLSQLAKGEGNVISQPAKQANRIAAQTGADANKIQKVSSDAHVARDGSQVQTHAFRNADTNELIEPKTIVNESN